MFPAQHAAENGGRTMKPEKSGIGRPAGPAADNPSGGFLKTRTFGVCFAVFSLAFLLFYVFVLTDYRALLYGDMQGFWMRAMERLNGNPEALHVAV
jgi:hypothetical protein